MRAATIRFAILCAFALPALCPAAWAQKADAPAVLDSVVAVVNNRAILNSDIDGDMRLSVLEPSDAADKRPDREATLDRLISRELIEEQMTPEEKKASQPTEKELADRVALLRTDLPACAQFHCATDAGWAAFLAANGITEDEAKAYLRLRLSLLSFIENRFQQGIRISQEEIDTYYRDTLVPEYAAGQPAPPLERVSHRISEILLQKQVNQLFSSWLDNLRKQGDVEILDAALASADASARTGGEQ